MSYKDQSVRILTTVYSVSYFFNSIIVLVNAVVIEIISEVALNKCCICLYCLYKSKIYVFSEGRNKAFINACAKFIFTNALTTSNLTKEKCYRLRFRELSVLA